MVFLYASTTIVYYLLLVLTATALAFSVTTNESYIFLISIGVVAIAILGLVITNKFAHNKYKNHSLSLIMMCIVILMNSINFLINYL